VIGYFVTGTDTNVGKTYVASMLARRARSKGLRVFAFKPLETGCQESLGADQRALVEAAGGWQTDLLCGVVQLRRAAAPRVAAREEKRAIDLLQLRSTMEDGARQSDLTIVEGAGGWRVPITDDVDIAALARQVGLPLLVVARAGLGTINHSLLTIEAVERDRCHVAAFVMSRRPDEDRDFALENLEEVSRRWGGRCRLIEDDEAALDELISSSE